MSDTDLVDRLASHIGGLFRCSDGWGPWPRSSIGVVVAVDEIDRYSRTAFAWLLVDGEPSCVCVGEGGIELIPREVGE